MKVIVLLFLSLSAVKAQTSDNALANIIARLAPLVAQIEPILGPILAPVLSPVVKNVCDTVLSEVNNLFGAVVGCNCTAGPGFVGVTVNCSLVAADIACSGNNEALCGSAAVQVIASPLGGLNGEVCLEVDSALVPDLLPSVCFKVTGSGYVDFGNIKSCALDFDGSSCVCTPCNNGGFTLDCEGVALATPFIDILPSTIECAQIDDIFDLLRGNRRI